MVGAVLRFLITAGVVHVVFVVPVKRLTALRQDDELAAEDAPAPDVELLTEIRDLLRAQQRP